MFSSWGRSSEPKFETLPQTEEVPRQPTLTFVIPFPEAPHGLSASALAKVPPFLLYAPLAARFEAPGEGETEAIQRKVTRKWQEHENEAREAVAAGDATFKNKLVGNVSKAMSWTKNSRVEFLVRTPNAAELKELRIVYPSSMPAHDIQEKFTAVLKATKAAAIRNGIIATAILPFVFVVELTFIPGPFEVNAVFAVASWTGASRASSIANGVANQKVAVSFQPDPRLEDIVFRVHELCWENRKIGIPMEKPHWRGEQEPMRGVELAALVLALINMHLDLGACEEYERNLELVSEDLEAVLLKGAKEWLACLGSGGPLDILGR